MDETTLYRQGYELREDNSDGLNEAVLSIVDRDQQAEFLEGYLDACTDAMRDSLHGIVKALPRELQGMAYSAAMSAIKPYILLAGGSNDLHT